MIQKGPKSETSARDFLPDNDSLSALAKAAKSCRGCPLYRDATQTVFGEGKMSARIVVVGEVPGDQEDRVGRPFIGPAGNLLRESLATAGADLSDIYVTNAVKHFKFTMRGKRRLHKKPSAREIAACRPWIEHELQVIAPDVLICLGATAARSLLGSTIRVTRQRGQWLTSAWTPNSMVTYHPSAILRIRESDERRKLRATFVEDLRKAVARAANSHSA